MDDKPTKGPFSNAQWTMIFDYMVRVDRLTDRAEFSGPNREANASKFMLVDELENLVKQISFYKVEGDDAFIRISVCGIEVASVSNDDPRCIGVIKFDAEQRTILAKIKVEK